MKQYEASGKVKKIEAHPRYTTSGPLVGLTISAEVVVADQKGEVTVVIPLTETPPKIGEPILVHVSWGAEDSE